MAAGSGEEPTVQSRVERSLAHRAYRELKDQILTCRLAPGSMVVAQRIAPEMGMSRTPVNEGLKMLVAEGLLEVIPRVGYLVTPITLADVQEIFQMRLALEPLAVDLALRRVTDPALQAFRQTCFRPAGRGRPGARPSEDPGFLGWVADAHDHFHLEVAVLSGNRRLIETIRALLQASRRMVVLHARRSVHDADWTALPDRHVAVLEAIMARDREAAMERMAADVRDGQQEVITALVAEIGP